MDVSVLLEPKIDLARITRVLDEMGHPGNQPEAEARHEKEDRERPHDPAQC